MSRPVIADDPVFLRGVLATCERLSDCLNADRKLATTVPELLAIAEATDWLQGQIRTVRRRLDRAESRAFGSAPRAAGGAS